MYIQSKYENVEGRLYSKFLREGNENGKENIRHFYFFLKKMKYLPDILLNISICENFAVGSQTFGYITTSTFLYLIYFII